MDWSIRWYSVQFSSFAQSYLTLRDPMDCSTPSFPIHHQLPELTQTHGHQVGDAIQPSHLLSSPSPPTFNLSQHQGLFQWVNYLHQVANVLELQHQSFQWTFIDWSPLGWTGWISLQSKGLSRVFEHHSSKASILHHSAFFIVQLSHPYMTTGKTTALTRWTFVGKVMSLVFDMLSRLVIAFLPRSNRLLILCAVPICSDFGVQKIKSVTVSIVSPPICHEVMGPDAMFLVFWMLSFLKVKFWILNLWIKWVSFYLENWKFYLKRKI